MDFKELFTKIPDFIKELFSESSKVSSMRVMAISALITAIILAIYDFIYTNITGKNIPDAVTLVGLFLGAAFGGKTISKWSENKITETQTDLNKKEEGPK